MAKNKNLKFLKSNYTLRTKHKDIASKKSSVYERDYMVTTNLGGWDSGSIPYGEGNFKIIYRDDEKKTRVHTYGNLLLNENGGTSWSYDDVKKIRNNTDSLTSDESCVVIKPIYTSLLDFAYFGSCTEMIKASVNDIIKKYPSELYVSMSQVTYYEQPSLTASTDEFGYIKTLGGDNMFLIQNPGNIDIYTQRISKTKENEVDFNELKYFCKSRNKYKILDPNEKAVGCVFRWDVETLLNRQCLTDGDMLAKVRIAEFERNQTSGTTTTAVTSAMTDFIIYVYYANNKIYYLTDKKWVGYHIRPIDSVVKEFTDSLDDFERFLMSRERTPIYTVQLDTLREDNTGFKHGKRLFTWPTVGGWNLDVVSSTYRRYLNDLLELADIYDEYYSDNLWRMMTHESIKNMDLTFSNPSKNEDTYDYNIGTTRLQGLFWAYGRLFDDLLRYAKNISTASNNSYNKEHNIADYLLTDKLEISGWEVFNPTNTLRSDTVVESLFEGVSKEYKLSDVNTDFYSTLHLNTKNIFQRKGTRHGIEMLMSMFGYCSYDYGKSVYMALPESEKIMDDKSKILQWDDLSDEQRFMFYDYELNEYVSVASNTVEDIYENIEDIPAIKYNFMVGDNEIFSEYNDSDYTFGLMARVVALMDVEGNTFYYLIPWFDKQKTYYSDKVYFQMYGGWNKISLKKISQNIAPEVNELISTSKFKIYDETVKYLKYKEDINSLLTTPYGDLSNGDIYYVNDLIDVRFTDNAPSGYTNYFTIVDREYCNELSDRGWKNIVLSEIENGSTDGLKVLYLETILDNYKGNNPHVGYGQYDDGKAYLDYFRQLFKYEIETDTADDPKFSDDMAYDCLTGEIIDDIKKCGFTVSDLVRDNMKTWYFTDTADTPLPILKKEYKDIEDIYGETVNVANNYVVANYNLPVYVGKESVKKGDTKLSTDLEAFNFETQRNGDNDEAAASSVINVKNLQIKFNAKFSKFNGFNEYLYNVIMPYVKQVIPSTTISEIIVDGLVGDEMCFEMTELIDIAKPNNYVTQSRLDKELLKYANIEELGKYLDNDTDFLLWSQVRDLILTNDQTILDNYVNNSSDYTNLTKKLKTIYDKLNEINNTIL